MSEESANPYDTYRVFILLDGVYTHVDVKAVSGLAAEARVKRENPTADIWRQSKVLLPPGGVERTDDREFGQTKADLKLGKRRFNKYVKLSKENPSMTFEEKLDLLPLSGGTKLKCGHTRFDHVLTGCDKRYRGG